MRKFYIDMERVLSNIKWKIVKYRIILSYFLCKKGRIRIYIYIFFDIYEESFEGYIKD